MKTKTYETPEASMVAFVAEQCVLTSSLPSLDLLDLEQNGIYNEEF